MSNPILEKYNLRRYKNESSDDQLINWIFDNSEAEAPETNVDEAWGKLQSKISEPKKKTWTSSIFLRVAASVALIAVVVFSTQEYWNPQHFTEVHAQSQGHKVTFPDGSKTILNEQAIVGYPERFDKTRTINFEGEAYFDIIKDSKPFIIKMNDIDVRVLGTAFNLSSSGENVEVFVERGSVAFEKGDQQIKVAKGQLGIFNTATLEIMVDTTPPKNIMSWRDGKFDFVDTPLKEVSSQLSRFYGVDFKLSSTLENCRVTARFDDAPLKDVLNILETILNASVSQDKTTIKIKGKGCQ